MKLRDLCTGRSTTKDSKRWFIVSWQLSRQEPSQTEDIFAVFLEDILKIMFLKLPDADFSHPLQQWMTAVVLSGYSAGQ
jgi:hypothetical protein